MGCADASMTHQRAARRRGGRLTAASASAAVAAYAPLYSLLLLLAIMLSNACVNAQQNQYLTKPEGLGVALGANVPLKHNAPETEDVEDPMPVVVEAQGEVGAIDGAGYLMDEEDDFTTADLFALLPEPAPEPAPAPAPQQTDSPTEAPTSTPTETPTSSPSTFSPTASPTPPTDCPSDLPASYCPDGCSFCAENEPKTKCYCDFGACMIAH